ncbi:serine hydrolase-like protein isoform X2 [Betta splendens]|uniref:Serine hydrolase-like protein isoform X2 n=1 Tax=Betta splendens TaxID=158456 RepID=A0A6P7N512_BETSP|nr:serine hydrolase-like protein isoform X2 [Betta splendens]
MAERVGERMCVSELRVPVPWGEIRGRVWGPDHGRPVLCLHGWADNCGSFNTLIPLLPRDCTYVTLDLAGHGRSSHRAPGVFYTFPAYVADVLRVADALQLRSFSIMGHSMGADVAEMFSALYPEMVDALILLDSYGIYPTDMKEFFTVLKEGMDKMLQFEKRSTNRSVYTFEEAVQRLLAANPALSLPSARCLLERGLDAAEGGFVFSRDPRVNFRNILGLSLEDSLDMHSSIQAPVLAVLAEDGFCKLFSDPSLEEFTSALHQSSRDKNHTMVTVPGDHHVHLNNPHAVAPFVTDFLRTRVLSQSVKHEHKL